MIYRSCVAHIAHTICSCCHIFLEECLQIKIPWLLFAPDSKPSSSHKLFSFILIQLWPFKKKEVKGGRKKNRDSYEIARCTSGDPRGSLAEKDRPLQDTWSHSSTSKFYFIFLTAPYCPRCTTLVIPSTGFPYIYSLLIDPNDVLSKSWGQDGETKQTAHTSPWKRSSSTHVTRNEMHAALAQVSSRMRISQIKDADEVHALRTEPEHNEFVLFTSSSLRATR